MEYRSKFSRPSKKRSTVTQKGPAFFERTWRHTSATLAMAHRAFTLLQVHPRRAYQLHRIGDRDDVVQLELVHLPALDLRRREGESVARQLASEHQGKVEEIRIARLGDVGRHLLRFGGGPEKNPHFARRRPHRPHPFPRAPVPA